MASPPSSDDPLAYRGPSVPTFGVRFETHDDFLVEYADHLRHGFVQLPLARPLPIGTPIRLRLRLPTSVALYLTGRAVSPDPSMEGASTRVQLDGLTEAQRVSLQECVESSAGARPSLAGTDPTRWAEDLESSRIAVLLVDDSVTHRLELGDALRGRGLRVRVAENGLLALSAALKRPPDVILTDVEMPQMDGWSLLRAVRQRRRLAHVPVVFLTRLGDELSRLRGYRMGVDDYLTKTMAPEEIVARLYGVLTRRRQIPVAAGAHGLRGDLEHVRLGSLLAFLESERRSGALALRCGNDHAILHLHDGTLLRLDNLGRYEHPHDRVFELLGWRFGHFEFFADQAVEPGAPANHGEPTPLSYLLMEHARRSDESNLSC